MLAPHPQRVALHNEVHARPYERMAAPLQLSHLALLAPDADAARLHLEGLLRARHLPLPAADASHLSIDLGGLQLRWEKHTEFHTYTFWRTARETVQSFDGDALRAVPQDWLAAMPGAWLVGLHLLVTDAPASDTTIFDIFRSGSSLTSSVASLSVSRDAVPLPIAISRTSYLSINSRRVFAAPATSLRGGVG